MLRCRTVLAMATVVSAFAVDTVRAGESVFVPLPDCSSLPRTAVTYSPEGLFPEEASANSLPPGEQSQGWRLLFDGHSMTGWHGFQRDRVPGAWRVEEGALTLGTWNEGDPVDERGDIRTAEAFEDFELRLQWAVAPGGNSGVFYLAREGVAEAIFESAPEMQILDDAGHEDGRDPTHRAGSAYDLYAPLCNALRPVGEYNDVRLVVRGGRVDHWLNGYRIVVYELDSPQWRERVARSKFRDMPGFARARRGYIGLQDHGDVVRFRNIRIREYRKP